MLIEPDEEGVRKVIERAVTTIGQNLAALIKDVDSANQPALLAKKAHVGKFTVQRLLKAAQGGDAAAETNAPTISTLIRIAAAFGVTLGYLLTPHDLASRLLDPTEYRGAEQVASDLKSGRHRQSP